MSTQQPVLANAEYAGFSMRFLAFLLDGLVVALPSLLIALGFAGVWYSIDSYLVREVPEFFAYLFAGAWWVALWVIWVPYSWLFTAVRGQTPGKMILGIRVVHRQSGRTMLGWTALPRDARRFSRSLPSAVDVSNCSRMLLRPRRPSVEGGPVGKPVQEIKLAGG